MRALGVSRCNYKSPQTVANDCSKSEVHGVSKPSRAMWPLRNEARQFCERLRILAVAKVE